MSEPLIEHLIQEKTAAIAVLQRHITAHETIRLVLKDLHRPTIAADQALTLLQHEAEHIHELARADRFHQMVAPSAPDASRDTLSQCFSLAHFLHS